MLLITKAQIIGDIYAEIRRHRSLLLDLEAVAAGQRPSAETLAAAPVMWSTRLRERLIPCLVGEVLDHPTLLGPQVVTSEVIALSPLYGWARTLSRFYRLEGEAMPLDRLLQ